MKQIIIVLLILISSNAIDAKNDYNDNRMVRYATLYQLFDGCISPIGIEGVNYMESVYKFWDFESFAGYILQEISEFPRILPEECLIDNISQTLVLPLKSVVNINYPVPVAKLKLSFEEDSDHKNRWLVVSYEIKDSDKPLEFLKQQCLELLNGLSKVEFNGNEAYEGAYDYIYSVKMTPERDSLWFSCYMPVSPRRWYTVNAGYAPNISYNKLPNSAPCNIGKGPFNEFLKRFNKSKDFRVNRQNFSDRANHADYEEGYLLPVQFGFNELVLKAIDESDLLPLRGHYDYKEYKSKLDPENVEYTESCGQWFYPTENSVIYSGWNTSSEFEEEDCGIIILFERTDDEWNTVASRISGKRFNDLVMKILHEDTGD